MSQQSWKLGSRWLLAAMLAALPAAVLAQEAKGIFAFTADEKPLQFAVPAPPAQADQLFALVAEPMPLQFAVDGTAANPSYFFIQAAAPGAVPRVQVVQAQPGQPGAPLGVAPSGGEYWIGVQLEPLPEIVTSQLKLERGMVVVHVFPDSPAAKAEFKTNDIILRAADKDIKAPDDLIHAVNDAKEKEIVVTVLRGGTDTTLKVTPAKRPVEKVEVAQAESAPHAAIVQQLDQLYRATPGGGVRLFSVGPGAVVTAQSAKFPENLEVVIEKRGDKPATIRVKRIQPGEDKTWEVTEDKIGDLPEDVRVHVQRLLSGQAAGAGAAGVRLHLLDAQAQAQDQVARARAQVAEAQNQLERTLRSYRLKVQPVPPGVTPPAPAVPGIAPQAQPVPTIVPRRPMAVAPPQASGSIEAKLDAILKKLDKDSAIERLDNELKALRKELEALRQEKK